MSNDFGGRSSRSTASSAPMGSGVAIIVTAVALILGFLILRKVNDTGPEITSGPDKTEETSNTTPDTGTATTTSVSTTVPQTFTGTMVQVANSSVQNRVAAMMSAALADAGFAMAEPTNGTAEPKLPLSKVIYNASDPAAKAVAETLGALLGGLVVEAANVPVPVTSGSWAAGSAVILLLGNDLAGKTLDQIQGVPVSGLTTTSVAGATSST
jgi:hypothetical protein